MMPKILSFVVLTLTALLFASPTSAVSEFNTDFYSTYLISPDGNSQVEHRIELTNNLAHIYANSYSLSLSSDRLSHLVVTDEFGELPVTTDLQGNSTTLHLTIPHPTIGKDQTKTLFIRYATPDLVEIIGNTLSINVPRLARSNEAKTYTRTVKVKSVAGLTNYLYPPPNQITAEGDFTVYTYTGPTSSSLSLLFGNSVTYQLDLTYLLKNKELQSVESELSLPPDTPYQQIILDRLVPPPVSVTLDPDGNYLARYLLKPQEKIEVTATLYATVTPLPSFPDPSSVLLPPDTNQPFWDIRRDSVQTLAQQLKTPDNVYHYLVDNFHYNFAKSVAGDRLGASVALANPNDTVCTEFTDTFVGLTRALNIPSREINGYAYTTNPTLRPLSQATDVLHAWPEYFDTTTSRWIQVDPTWGNTTSGIDYYHKLDFSHITFIRRGQESTYPLPAGVYKDNPQQKSIQVSVVNSPPPAIRTFEIRNGVFYNTGNTIIQDERVGFVPPYGYAPLPSTAPPSLYDKIKAICVSLLSKFSRLLRVST